MTQSPEEIKEKVTALVLEAYREQKPITKSVDEIMTLIEQVWNARTEEVAQKVKDYIYAEHIHFDKDELWQFKEERPYVDSLELEKFIIVYH